MPHTVDPPVAPRRPAPRELHGLTWTDEYAWMRESDNPQLAEYLRAERAYYDSATGHLADLSVTVFNEIDQRLSPSDESVRFRRGDHSYYTRTVAGSEFEQFVSSRDQHGQGEVLLDESELVDGQNGFVAIGVRCVSPDGSLLAYSADTSGDEVYTLRFRRIAAGRDLTRADDLTEVVCRSYYGGAWSVDSGTFFYTVHDECYRPYQVWRHRIGTPVASDALVFTEPDPRYEVTVRPCTSGEYVIIAAQSRDTSEAWLVPAARPESAPTVVAPRRRGIEYRVDHGGGDDLFVVTNDGAEEFRLMRVPVTYPDHPHWIEVAPAQPGERLHGCRVLTSHLLLELRRDGFPLLRAVPRVEGGEPREIHPGIEAGRITLAWPDEISAAATSVTVRVDSLVSPPHWYEVDLESGERSLVKRQVVATYQPERYRTERRHANAPDGTPVPVTLAWRSGTPLDGTAPCVMWGYGAYESCDDPFFDEALPSLLDRGVVYALTHPRGGGENGRRWWDDGHLARKENTFTDHIAVADWLADGIVDGTRIASRGLSAGGLLQGVVFGRRPERWRAVVAEVPFVDVVNTMLDESIPLTANEWDEWGDPRTPEGFALLRSYSPYENVPVGLARPTMLVTGAVHDPRVMVHEPAKWVARLRATSTADDRPLLFRVELGAGAHTGPAGRYAHYRYEAEVYAFLLDALGIS